MSSNSQDIRWHQRLSNYSKALLQLNEAVKIANQRALTNLEQQGLIQSFEFTHELAWNVMKDYFYYQGNTEIRGSRDATREAFKFNLISHGDVWMDMIVSRNKTSHTYDEDTASEITENIINDYATLFNEFHSQMVELRDGEQNEIFKEE
ncbi:nucleotidyltransferase [Muricauda sp. TY007]|uniref:nucleotidyltransferase substrate binding protein n=1 Tax=Allomuricauda sp. TY007 TaxID=2683200 RepID=UPI0013C27811|nr:MULTISPECIES: nucleotidyltransferase substrate binding protein [unclassified Allomuricauda]MBA4744001.1 nucleotidyltransferase substrate binding protein [Allomuricauda sp.]NDV14859.1 nucleotidyltransferase [Muricauda sp. TY007]